MADDDDKMELWDRVFSTDPAQTKTFKRGGGFSGTAIKPYWIIMRATEEFGPVGVGWGWKEIDNKIFVAENGAALWMSYIKVWYTHKGLIVENGPEQWGATELVSFRQEGTKTFVDEEAAKKAVTDGLTKCLSYLGFAGDVHMGLFDDNKYVAQRKVEERKAREQADAGEEKNGEVVPNDKTRKGEIVKPKPKRQPDEDEDVTDKAEPRINKGDERLGFDKAVWAGNVKKEVKKLTTEKAVRNYWESQKPTARIVNETDQELVEELLKVMRVRLEFIKGGDEQ